MAVQDELVNVLDDVLHLSDRATLMDRETALLGAVPELDSVSVMGVIAALESRFNFTVEPGELDAESFATVGSLSDFVTAKLVSEHSRV